VRTRTELPGMRSDSPILPLFRHIISAKRALICYGRLDVPFVGTDFVAMLHNPMPGLICLPIRCKAAMGGTRTDIRQQRRDRIKERQKTVDPSTYFSIY